MGKYKSINGLMGVIVFGLLFIVSCQNPGNSLEESVAPYLELQEVDGASNVTMTVNRGTAQGMDSYFAVDFTNVESDGLVSEELTEGWCLDYQKPIAQNNDVHTGIKMFNTFGSKNWKPANYLMNIKDDLQKADPSLTYKEIQIALWSLIEKPAFNLDKALAEGSMPSRLLTNGAPNFSVEKTRRIIDKVRSEVEDFNYKPGTPVIVYSNTAIDDQDVGYVSGQSAWGFSSKDGAVDSEISTEFCGSDLIQGNKWGWTNGTFASGSSGTFDLIAGAGNCDLSKGEYVGTFSFSYQNGVLNYTLSLNVYNDFKNLHIHAGNDPLPKKGNKGNGKGGGKNKKSEYTAAPGQFIYPTTIDVQPDSDGTPGIKKGVITGLNGDIYIAVHLGG